MNNRKMIFGAILSVLACFVLLPQMRAAPDTFLNSNTWDGFHALNAGKSANSFSTADGWQACVLQTDALNNSGFGAGALALQNSSNNTALGAGAATFLTTGTDVNAVGAFALFNGNGSFNNAHGREALFNNTSGSENDAFGDLALLDVTTGSMNTAMGDDALDSVTTGSGNTGMGKEACNTCTTGSDNVAIGHNALNGTVSASNNIAIGVPATGPFADLSFTCFIGSIHGEPTSNIPSTTTVYVDSNNVVGGIISSRRVKHDIKPMDKASEVLYALEPIS